MRTEISLEIKTLYISGSNAFDPKEKVEGKVSKRLSYFRELSKKVEPKVAYGALDLFWFRTITGRGQM